MARTIFINTPAGEVKASVAAEKPQQITCFVTGLIDEGYAIGASLFKNLHLSRPAIGAANSLGINLVADDSVESVIHKKNEIFEKTLDFLSEELKDYLLKQKLAELNKANVIVTTADISREYEIIGPVYFQVSNKGLFSSHLSKLSDQYTEELRQMKQLNLVEKRQRKDWGFLYGQFSVGQNEFDKAFYIAVQELKKRAACLGADAIVGMRQDIDLDTNNIQFFYLQMYGTAVKFLNARSKSNKEFDLNENDN